jgi:beta-glucosidase-like glycosyl hydrolase
MDAIRPIVYRQIRSGEVGSILNIGSVELVNELQKNSQEESKLGIPLLIARDVIHGFKTMFPIPLGQAASFNGNGIRGSNSCKKLRKKVFDGHLHL